jgi:hypothetical protein
VQSAEIILSRIPGVAWFSAAERQERDEHSHSAMSDYLRSCGNEWPGRWATGWEAAAKVAVELDDATSFWRTEERWRQQAVSAARQAGRADALAELLHRLSVIGYEAVRPAAPNEELARVASGAALWTVAEAITWAVVEDILPLANPFTSKLRLFELGHWPLGVERGSIVVL